MSKSLLVGAASVAALGAAALMALSAADVPTPTPVASRQPSTTSPRPELLNEGAAVVAAGNVSAVVFSAADGSGFSVAPVLKLLRRNECLAVSSSGNLVFVDLVTFPPGTFAAAALHLNARFAGQPHHMILKRWAGGKVVLENVQPLNPSRLEVALKIGSRTLATSVFENPQGFITLPADLYRVRLELPDDAAAQDAVAALRDGRAEIRSRVEYGGFSAETSELTITISELGLEAFSNHGGFSKGPIYDVESVLKRVTDKVKALYLRKTGTVEPPTELVDRCWSVVERYLQSEVVPAEKLAGAHMVVEVAGRALQPDEISDYVEKTASSVNTAFETLLEYAKRSRQQRSSESDVTRQFEQLYDEHVSQKTAGSGSAGGVIFKARGSGSRESSSSLKTKLSQAARDYLKTGLDDQFEEALKQNLKTAFSSSSSLELEWHGRKVVPKGFRVTISDDEKLRREGTVAAYSSIERRATGSFVISTAANDAVNLAPHPTAPPVAFLADVEGAKTALEGALKARDDRTGARIQQMHDQCVTLGQRLDRLDWETNVQWVTVHAKDLAIDGPHLRVWLETGSPHVPTVTLAWSNRYGVQSISAQPHRQGEPLGGTGFWVRLFAPWANPDVKPEDAFIDLSVYQRGIRRRADGLADIRVTRPPQ